MAAAETHRVEREDSPHTDLISVSSVLCPSLTERAIRLETVMLLKSARAVLFLNALSQNIQLANVARQQIAYNSIH